MSYEKLKRNQAAIIKNFINRGLAECGIYAKITHKCRVLRYAC